MKKSGKINVMWVLVLSLVVAGFTLNSAQAQTEQQKQERAQVREDVKKDLEEMGMPILTGVEWQKATQSEKVAFVWGVCHVISIETAIMKRLPSLKAENFSAKSAEGLAGMKINDIVRSVDEYYKANPAQQGKAVVGVMWDSLIKPKLKTGIAGHPLQP
jgi:hypothetical protein